MVYCEFMSEMRRPFDFWKALLIAEAFIFSVYIFFGVYVYSFQGQYVINPANQGMSMRGPLVAGNNLYLVTGLIAAALYGNIGIKVLYQACFKELLHLPDCLSDVLGCMTCQRHGNSNEVCSLSSPSIVSQDKHHNLQCSPIQ